MSSMTFQTCRVSTIFDFVMTTLILLQFLIPISLALHALPETFQSFPLTHPHFASLSANCIAVDSQGEVYIAGTGIPTTLNVHEVSFSTQKPVSPRFSRDEPHNRRNSSVRIFPSTVKSNDIESSFLDPKVFVARVSSSGDVSWLRVFQSNGSDSVSALLLHAGHIFVFGTSTASIEDSDRTSEPGKPSVFVSKLTKSGKRGWDRPVMFGSGGVDAISAVAVDETKYFPHLYVSGSVGGQAFHEAQRDRLDTNAEIGKHERIDGTLMANDNGEKTKGNGAQLETEKEVERHKQGQKIPKAPESDLFVVKIDPRSGKLEAAVQIPLERYNSADALAVHNGIVYAAVNSYNFAPFDPSGTSALHAFRADNLSYHAIDLPPAFNCRGDFMQAMEADKDGNLYLAGFVLRGKHLKDGKFVMHKYSTANRTVQWEKELGNHTEIEPRVSMAISHESGNIYVTGHSAGMYKERKESRSMLLRLPLTVVSTEGKEVMKWDRTTLYPLGFEEISTVAVDKDENILYAGKWFNPRSQTFEATVGSFGASSFTTCITKGEETPGPAASVLMDSSESRGTLAPSFIGLVCLCAGLGLVVVGSATFLGRRQILDRKGLVYPAQGPERGDIDFYADGGTEFQTIRSQEEGNEVRLDLRKAEEGPKIGGSAGPI